MAAFAISVFRLFNERGYTAPPLNFIYREQDTGAEWRVSCGGTRAYLVRRSETPMRDPDTEAAESHFMARRIATGLLLAGVGLFSAVPAGRLLFSGIEGKVTWIAVLDRPDPLAAPFPPEVGAKVIDWLDAISTHTTLRRAADDAWQALSNPHEALVFVYRGFEWIVTGLGITWDELAGMLGIQPAEIREFKKFTNHATGVRHASESGQKLRASVANYGTWVAGLVDTINAARKRLDPAFVPMPPQEVADAIMRAVPDPPYA